MYADACAAGVRRGSEEARRLAPGESDDAWWEGGRHEPVRTRRARMHRRAPHGAPLRGVTCATKSALDGRQAHAANPA
ncbi:hypothetical protein WS62_26010 [Burkholderia sp. ABCPW 14]|nr:hypothetical protein WS62_26010 [Burkholderia sp. ABCPW 14]